jgi:hypothetical protein
LIAKYQLQLNLFDYQQAKQCALIAVEEILKSKATEPTDDAGKFWEEVKSELLRF